VKSDERRRGAVPRNESELALEATLSPEPASANRTLVIAAFLSTILYGSISLLSWRFGFHIEGDDRPIIAVLLLYAATFGIYLNAIASVKRMQLDVHSTKIIVVAAVLFRVVMLFSLPIQEVDLYRYLWDGAVCTEGVSPFAFSPQQVAEAREPSANAATDGLRRSDKLRTADLNRLIQMLDREPTMAEILDRVHFPELPTIYPPTSQAVFAAVSFTTPSGTSLLSRVFIIKAWLVGFDIATLFVVIALLRLANKPVHWCLIYAWCPLLMKEVANSGHLDAIAVFLTTLAVCLLARSETRLAFRWLGVGSSIVLTNSATAFVLALAVGAKLYPIVLVPIFAAFTSRRFRFRSVIAPAVIFMLATAALLYPMIPNPDHDNDPSRGVVTFLKQFEMNDFLFLNIIENVKPTYQRGPHEVAWFTVVPENVRIAVVETLSSGLNMTPERVPFFITRVLTGAMFLCLSLTMAWKFSARVTPVRDRVSRLLEGGFLTLAWFWLLCPTQNPWYWTWALPLLPFATSRVWLLMSGLTMLYYLRFWLSYHFPNTSVMGSPYTGPAFFDFVVTWIEFGPWFACLLVSYVYRQRRLSHFTTLRA